jgi:hypothetical protein
MGFEVGLSDFSPSSSLLTASAIATENYALRVRLSRVHVIIYPCLQIFNVLKEAFTNALWHIHGEI